MKMKLSEMTLEELWELFPVFLVQPRDKWITDFNEMETFLRQVLSGYPVKRINHIGSTAIHEICAKDIVDILIELSEKADIESAAKDIEKNGGSSTIN